jgi:hypothetical protein
MNLFRRLASFDLGPPLIAVSLVLLALAWMRDRRGGEPEAASEGPDIPFLFAIQIGIALNLLLWGRLGHASDRFLAPAILASIVLFGASVIRFSRGSVLVPALAALLMVLLFYGAPLAFLRSFPYGPRAINRISEEEFLRAGLGRTADMFRAVNALPENARVLAIHEARGYYFRRPVTLASVFDRHPIRDAIAGAVDAGMIRARLAAAGYTHLLVNEYEAARLLRFHPPLALLNDSGFRDLRAQGPEADAALALGYLGYSEFSAEPLTEGERLTYAKFLRWMRQRALGSGESPAPAFWIAPLGP